MIAERLGGIKSGGAIFVETFIGVSPFRLPFKLSQFTSKFAPLAAHTATVTATGSSSVVCIQTKYS